ncbi:MAG: adenylate/guanylate cyclase domain-containing protein [Cyclobacteriaceae bacterium]
MLRWYFLLLFALLIFPLKGRDNPDSLKNLLENHTTEDAYRVDLLLELNKNYLNASLGDCQQYGLAARDLAEKINYQKGRALAFKSIGLCYHRQGDFPEALTNWNQSLRIFETIGDVEGQSNMFNNIGAVYHNVGDLVKALDYYFKSLKTAEESGNKLRIATALSNIGAAYFDNPVTMDKALPYYLEALQFSEQDGDQEAIGTISVNIGEIYFNLNQLDEALTYFEKSRAALAGGNFYFSLPYTLSFLGKVHAKKEDFPKAIEFQTRAFQMASLHNYEFEKVFTLANLADTYLDTKDYKKALKTYLEAKQIAEAVSSKEIKHILEGLVSTYSALGDFKNAFQFQAALAEIKDNLYTEDNAKTIQRFQMEFETEKKQAQIILLTIDRELQAVSLEQQRYKIYGLTAGTFFLFAAMFFLLKNIRLKTRANTELSLRNKEISSQKEEISAQRDDIERQKGEIESLILNILPEEVAHELRKTGLATPRYYENVSVLFTDFREFTSIAEGLSAQDLVAELNECFVAFDDIIERHGLEKIKTIGDAYMCAGGIPTPSSDHAYNAVSAALAIQEYIEENNRKRLERGSQLWELRIGIHSGPVVAGVVGRKKFAYDIWGNTVNIANRLESSGEVGRVNISSATYNLIKGSFKCEFRGKILAKNMGQVDMYFVDKELAEVRRA